MVDFFKFTEQLNLLHPTALLAMKFTAEVFDTETIGQLHDDVILLQLPESLSLLFSCAN